MGLGSSFHASCMVVLMIMGLGWWCGLTSPVVVEGFVLPALPSSSSHCRVGGEGRRPLLTYPVRASPQFSSFWLDATRETPLQEWKITEATPGTPSPSPTRSSRQDEEAMENMSDEDCKGRSIGGSSPLRDEVEVALAEAKNEQADAAPPSHQQGNEEQQQQQQQQNQQEERKRGNRLGLNLLKVISGGGAAGSQRVRGQSNSVRCCTTPRQSTTRATPATATVSLSSTTTSMAASSSSTTPSSSSSSSSFSLMTALKSAASNSADTTNSGNQGNLQVLVELMSSDPFKRLLVWLSFLGLGWKLRSFYGIILGTFVLSYIGSSAVRWSEKNGNKLAQRMKLPPLPRRFWALAYISIVLTGFCSLTVLTVPRVVGETNYLALLVESENPYVFVADGLRKFLGPDVSAKLEAFLLSVTGDEGRAFATGVLTASSSSSSSSSSAAATMARKGLSQQLGDLNNGVWTAARKSRFAKLMEFSLKGYIKQAYYVIQKLLTSSTKLVYKGLLSLLFSFMIIWDLPRLAKGTRRLADSRLGYAYDVLAPQLTAFAKLVGQSFEVQSVIALVNTLLTTLGLIMLKIPGYGFMSLVVLITSFIPVFGVFLSTFPMALVALSEYGVGKMLDVILMVIGIHVVEAYCLSPLIYSATVKLHPVLIVAALYMMEHLAGLQGVFLAVPVTMFVIRQVIGINPPSSGHVDPAAGLSDEEEGNLGQGGMVLEM